MELIAFLRGKKLFTEEECRVIDSAFGRQKVSKGARIPQTKGHATPLIFMESGLLRVFFLKDGKDVTHFFTDENYFILSLDSVFNDQPGRYEWEALEPCVLRTINYDDYLLLEKEYPMMARVLLDFSMEMLHLFSLKINMHQFQSASDRYRLFLEMYPNLRNRISLGSTASFLGVTQQTLSVVRGEK